MTDEYQPHPDDRPLAVIDPVLSASDLPDHSLNRRYLFKLGTSVTMLLSNMVMQSVVLRALGPALFGNFSFLTDFFTAITRFFDGGTSFGFYTKITQRHHDRGLIRFYWEYWVLVGMLCFVLVATAQQLGWDSRLWPNVQGVHVWLAVCVAMTTFMMRVASYIMDAYGLTVPGEIARMVQTILSVIFLLVIFVTQQLTLSVYFIYLGLAMLGLVLAWQVILKRHRISMFPQQKLSGQERRKYISEFYRYASPLFLCAVVALLTELFDRWLLQRVAGSVEQGYFGLARQLAIACFMFTGAMTPLLMREFALAFSRQDFELMRRTFKQYAPMLYTISAYFALFVSVQANHLSVIFGGQQFARASVPITIMAFYPLLQTYGQLCSSLMLATNRTKILGILSMIFSLLALPLMLYLVGSASWGGLEMGATGLAVKMVAVQFVSVQVLLYFNTRYLRISFFKLLVHQIAIAVVFWSLAQTSSVAIDLLEMSSLPTFLLAGILYTLLIAGICYLVPTFSPVSPDQWAQWRKRHNTS